MKCEMENFQNWVIEAEKKIISYWSSDHLPKSNDGEEAPLPSELEPTEG